MTQRDTDDAAAGLAKRLRLMLFMQDVASGFTSTAGLCSEARYLDDTYGMSLGHRYCCGRKSGPKVGMWTPQR